MHAQLRLFDVAPFDPSVVYIAKRSQESGLYLKIGTTTNLARRMKELGTAPLLTLPGGKQLEAQLHYRFRAQRLAGEWFLPEAPLWDFISANLPVASEGALAA